jgi:thiamine biosynthesis lipoprotein
MNLLLPLLLSGLCSPEDPAAAPLAREVRLMGTVFRVEMEAETRSKALLASEAAITAVESVEQRLSTWRPDSELSIIGRASSGTALELSPAMGLTLQRAFYWSKQTGGAFDPSLSALIQVWDLRGSGRRPTTLEIKSAMEDCGIEHYATHFPQRITPLRMGIGLEEGGFGKGAALDAAAKRLRELGIERALLDLGGQVLVLGGGEAPVLPLAHPDDRGRGLLNITLQSGSIATSGNSERGLRIDGKRIGHLLDPRTGQPAPDFGSVTVWCANALDADCLSTALYVLGADQGLAFVEQQPGVEALYLIRTSDGILLRATDGMRSRLGWLDPSLQTAWSSASAPTQSFNSQ